MVKKAQRAAKQAKRANQKVRLDWQTPEFWTEFTKRILKEMREAKS